MGRFLIILTLSAHLLIGCTETAPDEPGELRLVPPPGFAAVPYPADNKPTHKRVELGEKLFNDPSLSSDGTVSCRSCHLPEKAFTDGRATSPGVFDRPGTRNAPTLINVAYQPYLMREGGVPTLEMQVLVPIQEHNEFDMNILDVVEIAKQNNDYVRLSEEAYGREFDSWVLTRAISAYERTLLGTSSPYDRFVFNKDASAFTEQERRGYDIFTGDNAQCATCHSGAALTSYGFANTGLYDTYDDPGRERFTSDPADRAKFKIPSLRNVEVTPPYMHDGSMTSLEQVVEHYNSGGSDHPNKDPRIKPLGLSEQQRQELVAFLKTLTDDKYQSVP